MDILKIVNKDLYEQIDHFRQVVSTNMKQRRIALNMTQENLADETELSTETIAKLENQRQWFSVESLILICNALETTPCQLFLDPKIDHLIPVAEVFDLADKYNQNFTEDDKAVKRSYRVRNSRRTKNDK